MENGFNPDPNKQAVELIFSQKKIKPVHLPLFFNGVEVKKVDSHKHLGLTLAPKLTLTAISMKRSQKLERVLELLGIFHLSPPVSHLPGYRGYRRYPAAVPLIRQRAEPIFFHKYPNI